MVWVDNDVLAAQGSHAEFLGANASEANRFPNFWHINFLCGVECSLVLFQLDVCLSKLLEVMDFFVKYLTSKVQSLVEASVTRLLDISLVGL
jgi:hypothetical protein